MSYFVSTLKRDFLLGRNFFIPPVVLPSYLFQKFVFLPFYYSYKLGYKYTFGYIIVGLALLQLPYTTLILYFFKKLVSTHFSLRNFSISVCRLYPYIGCIEEETM